MKFWKLNAAHCGLFGGLVFVGYTAALNKDMPLLWIAAPVFLAMLVIGLIGPWANTWGVRLERKVASRAQEGDTLELSVTLHNDHWWPRFMVELWDNPLRPTKDDELHPVLAAPLVGPKESVQMTVHLACEQRGRYVLGPACLASAFPLGLLTYGEATTEVPFEVLVYPREVVIRHVSLEGSSAALSRADRIVRHQNGQSDFVGLREYRRGDLPKHIHWPSVARHGTLMVREMEAVAQARLWLTLDCSAAFNCGKGRHAAGEYAITLAASLARWAVSQGIPVGATWTDAARFEVAPRVSTAHLEQIHTRMARLALKSAEDAYAQCLTHLAHKVAAGDTVIVVARRQSLTQPSWLTACHELTQARANIQVLIFDDDSFLLPGKGSSVSPVALPWPWKLVRCGQNLAEVFA